MTIFPYRWLWHYSHALEARFFLLDELHRLRAAGKILPRRTAARIWRSPAEAEDWIHLSCFLDPREKVLLIDVGANVGDFTKNFLEFFPNSSVDAFEPVKESFDTLDACFRDDPRVRTHHCALSDFDGERMMEVAEVTTFSSFERYTADATRLEAEHTHRQMTDCRRLDGFQFPTDGRTVVLKIDVQGHEVEVLKAGRKTLDEVSVCLIETSFANQYEKREPSFSNIANIMREAGLFPIIFQEYGRNKSAYAVERDVLFVKKELLKNIWFDHYR